MSKYKVFLDSASDIPHELAKEYDIGVFGMPVTFEDGKTYIDWVELQSNEFYKMLAESKETPTTSQVPLMTMVEGFTKALESYDGVIGIFLSSKGSGTYQTAVLAKNMVLENNPDANIEIVDSMAYSLFNTVMAVEGAKKMQSDDLDISEIVSYMKYIRNHLDVAFVVDTLKYLEKGGRINKTSLVMGTLLDIKPVLSVKNGIIDTIGKFRGSKKVFSKLVEYVKAGDADLSKPYCIVHSNAKDRATELAVYLKQELGVGDPFIIGELGSIVGTHTGPGVLAVFYWTKESLNVYEDV